MKAIGIEPITFSLKVRHSNLLSYASFTSNQIRTDDIYLEGRGYNHLTILVSLFLLHEYLYK